MGLVDDFLYKIGLQRVRYREFDPDSESQESQNQNNNENKADPLKPKHGHERYAPGTKIRYNPELVDNLYDDHKALLKLFEEIVENVQHRDKERCRKGINTFKDKLHAHILRETTQLYLYLEHALPTEEERAQSKSFRSEMDQIIREVNQFFKETESLLWTEEDFTSLGERLTDIGNVLLTRIEAEEEKLYPIYLNAP